MSLFSKKELQPGNCINCGEPVATPYCSQCGQPFPAQRINLGQLFADLQGRVYGTNGLFLRTFRDLTFRPGAVAAKYVEGNRILYNRPIGYFFLMITIMLILAGLLGIDYVDFLKGTTAGLDSPASSGQERFKQQLLQFISDNTRLISFAIVPVQAAVARWLFFRRSGYSYLEHSVLPFFAEGHINLLMMVNLIIFRMTTMMVPFYIITVLSVLYFGFSYSGWMTYQSRMKSFFKGIGIFITSQLLIGLLSAIGALVYLITHPEAVEMMEQK